MKTRIYGSSDDLVEIDGEIYDEFSAYGHETPVKILASDGTKATIIYNGEWKINIEFPGTLYIEIVPSSGEDRTHQGNAKDCTSYSDVLILNHGIQWVKIGKETFKP